MLVLGSALLGAAPAAVVMMAEGSGSGSGLLGLTLALLLVDKMADELLLHDGALTLHGEELLVGGLLNHVRLEVGRAGGTVASAARDAQSVILKGVAEKVVIREKGGWAL